MIYQFSVPQDHVRSIPDPMNEGCRTLYVLVKTSDIPATLPLGPDPRIPKPTGEVVKRIKASLKSNDGRFHLLNRGITISAKHVSYDNVAKLLTLDVPEDDEQYGILDGGHTHHSINAVNASIQSPKEISDQYVKLEVMVGVEDSLGHIAGARNFSQDLRKTTLDAYVKKYDWFLEALGPYKDKVRASENDPQPVPVIELIQLMTAVNAQQFSRDRHPIESYTSAEKCREYFTSEGDSYGYRKLAGIASDVLKLYDTIRYKWTNLYNAEDADGKRGCFGKTVEANKRKRGRAAVMTYHFIDEVGDPQKGQYPIEAGLAKPVLAAFRCLLEEKDGQFVWSTDPFEFFNRHGHRLIRQMMDISDTYKNNPNAIGREKTVYSALYESVRSAYNDERLEQFETLAKQKNLSL